MQQIRHAAAAVSECVTSSCFYLCNTSIHSEAFVRDASKKSEWSRQVSGEMSASDIAMQAADFVFRTQCKMQPVNTIPLQPA